MIVSCMLALIRWALVRLEFIKMPAFPQKLDVIILASLKELSVIEQL